MILGSPNIVPPEELKTNFLQSVRIKVCINLMGCNRLCSKSRSGSSTEITTEDCAAK